MILIRDSELIKKNLDLFKPLLATMAVSQALAKNTITEEMSDPAKKEKAEIKRRIALASNSVNVLAAAYCAKEVDEWEQAHPQKEVFVARDKTGIRFKLPSSSGRKRRYFAGR